MRKAHLVAAASITAFAAMMATSAAAQQRQFNIEAGSLQNALDSYGRQSGRPIVYRTEDVRGATSPGYRGSGSPDEVLPAILANSDFTVRSQSSGAVAVVRTGNVTSASPQPASEGSDLGDIVVTARRTAENAQKTPVAITSFNSQDLKNRVIQDATDIAKVTPSLQAPRASTNPSGLQIQMRAQVQTDTTAISAGSVGVYFDDIYIGGSPIAGGLLLPRDLERVEVLKGPQGTLYGRNVTGGVLKFVSQKPKDKFEGYMTGGLGNYERRFLDGMINVPLAEGVALRLNGSVDENGGYSKDINNNNRPLDDNRTWGLRGALSVEAAPNLKFLLQGWYGRGRSNGADVRTIYVNPNDNTAITNIIIAEHINGATAATFAPLIFGGTPQQVQAAKDARDAGRAEAFARVAAYANAPRNAARGPVNDALQQFSDARLAGGAFTAALDVGDVTFKSITGYSLAERNSNFNVGAGPWIPILSNQFGRVSQWTEELQATGTVLDGRLKFAAGLYFIDQKIKDDRKDSGQYGAYPLYLGQFGLGVTNGSYSDNSIHIRGWAGYGQASFAVTDTVNVTGGLRYTKEKFSVTTNQYSRGIFGGASVCNTPTLPAGTSLANCFASDSVQFSNWSFTAGADWSPVRDVMLYGKFSRGFKSGGLNPFGVGGAPFVPFKPEVADEFEIGLKSQFLNRRARFNLAYYHTNYKDVQRTVVTIIREATPTTPAVQGTGVRNAASAKIDGIEAELTVIPVEGLTVGLSGAWTHPKYVKYSQFDTDYPNNFQDLSSTRFRLVPEWMYSVNAAYVVPASFGEVTAAVGWTWRDTTLLFETDGPQWAASPAAAAAGNFTPDSVLTQKAYGTLDASLRFDLAKQNVSVQFWGKNILNKRYYETASAITTLGLGYGWANFGAPATYGADVTFRF